MNGEAALLRTILRGLPRGGDLLVGPGDDCAVIRGGGLLKTDCVAEDVHFLRSQDPARVGWKAVCRPLSDIAAMGGIPRFALLTLFSPPGVGSGYWEAFYRGVRRAARAFGVLVAGGEISRQPHGISVSVALTGTMNGVRPVLRSGGRPGDRLFVTGRLGGAAGGHHLDFRPRLAEGRWLAERRFARAMMDLSDGLGSDLPRLARASGCGFAIDPASLPCRPGADVSSALRDGEDYELLLAVAPRNARRLAEVWPFPRTPLTCVGELREPGDFPGDWPSGWDHFSVVSGRLLGQRGRSSAGATRRKQGTGK